MMARDSDEEQGRSLAELRAGRLLDNWQLFAIGCAYPCYSLAYMPWKPGQRNCLLCIGKKASARSINKRLSLLVGGGAAYVS